MIYLFSEDSKSGSDIWELILKLSPNPTKLLRCSGIRDLQTKLEGITLLQLENLSDQDIFIIAYDNSSKVLARLMRKFQNEINPACPCYITSYVSFESAILQFTKLQDWITPSTKELAPRDQWLQQIYLRVVQLEAEGKLQDEFWNYEGEYSGVIKEFYEMLDSSTEVQDRKIRTREQALASLLAQLTNNTGFHITKSKIGACWRESCCWGEDQLSLAFKKHCGIEEYLTAQEKILELIDHSGFTNCLRDVDGDVVSLHDALEISYFL